MSHEVKLLPCPWCLKPPVFNHRGMNAGASVIECLNDKCLVMPFTRALSHSGAISAWNARPTVVTGEHQSAGAIIAYLRAEANAARSAQANAADGHPDKLYRMGQKDGLLLAADAIERWPEPPAQPEVT